MTTQVEAIQALIKLMENPNAGSPIRCAAAEGLGYAGGVEARTHLVKMMTSINAGVEIRSAAARALGHATSN